MRSERKKGRREKEARGGRRVQEGGESIRICFIKLTKEARKIDKNTQVYRQIIQQEGSRESSRKEEEKWFLLTEEAEESLVRRRNL